MSHIFEKDYRLPTVSYSRVSSEDVVSPCVRRWNGVRVTLGRRERGVGLAYVVARA